MDRTVFVPRPARLYEAPESEVIRIEAESAALANASREPIDLGNGSTDWDPED
jgi:hypothetical protein